MRHIMGLHAYGVPDVPPGSVWWRNPQPSIDSKQGESDEGRRKEERDQQNLFVFFCVEKDAPYLSLYRAKGGALAHS